MPRMLAMPLVPVLAVSGHAGKRRSGSGLSGEDRAGDHSARAGGGGDIFTRALTDELQKRLGRSFVVENRTGGGSISARACAESPPDGYTICVISNEPIVYNRFLFKACRSIRRRISSRSPICSSTRSRLRSIPT
jgi:hypothetical protein